MQGDVQSDEIDGKTYDGGAQVAESHIFDLFYQSVSDEFSIYYSIDDKGDISNGGYRPKQSVNAELESGHDESDTDEALGQLDDEVDSAFS